MRIYCVQGGGNKPQYFSSKKKAIKSSNWEYHKRMHLYGCNSWFREGVYVSDIPMSKNGVLLALNDKLEWKTVQEPRWMPHQPAPKGEHA